jgi:hypothetical protein
MPTSTRSRAPTAGTRPAPADPHFNYDDPVEVAVDGWMKSAGHRRNILEPRYRQTGFGVAIAGDGAIYFTQLFLDPPRPSPAPQQGSGGAGGRRPGTGTDRMSATFGGTEALG